MINVFESFAARQPGAGALTVTRAVTASPAYVDGYPAAAASTSTFAVVAQVSPASDRDMRTLADQQITGQSLSLLCRTLLIPRDKTREGDRLSGTDLDLETDATGTVWIVISARKHYAPDGDVFYRALVARDATQ
jgi:hypothetical protein